MRKLTDEEKRLRGTRRRKPDTRSLAGRSRPFHLDEKLTPALQILLSEMPVFGDELAAATYEQTVRSGPWFEAVDRALLVVFATSFSVYRTAANELDHCLRDPTLLNPRSEAARAAKLYGRIVESKTALLLKLSSALGLSPQSRVRAGIKIEEPSRDDPDDPWHALRLRLVPKPDPEGAAPI